MHLAPSLARSTLKRTVNKIEASRGCRESSSQVRRRGGREAIGEPSASGVFRSSDSTGIREARRGIAGRIGGGREGERRVNELEEEGEGVGGERDV